MTTRNLGVDGMRIVPVITAAALLLLGAGCSSSGHSTDSVCGNAVQESNHLLAQASASAAVAAHPTFGPPAPDSTGFASLANDSLARSRARSDNLQAAAKDEMLAAYIVVQHPTCFSDTVVAAAQKRIDQTKAQQ